MPHMRQADLEAKVGQAESDLEAEKTRASELETQLQSVEQTHSEEIAKLHAEIEEAKAAAASAASASSDGAAAAPPIKPIMEDIYTMLYAEMELDDKDSSLTTVQVNKGIRNVLKQVASKYGP